MKTRYLPWILVFSVLLLCGLEVLAQLSADKDGTAQGGGKPPPKAPNAGVYITNPQGKAIEHRLFKNMGIGMQEDPSDGEPLLPEEPGIHILTPQGAEITNTLFDRERPAIRHLRKMQGAGALPASESLNQLLHPEIEKEHEYDVRYELPEEAKIHWVIFNEQDMPVLWFDLAPGRKGAEKGANEKTVWDGRDFLGRETPPGTYRAIAHIEYVSGKRETREMELKRR